MTGHVYKRCSCPPERDADGKKLTCPKSHGSWTWVAWAPAVGMEPRRQVTKGGFKTKREAEAALRAWLVNADRGQVVLPSKLTLGQYLADWLERVEPSLATTTAANYRVVLSSYLLPHLGEQPLTGLRGDHLVRTYRKLLVSGGRGGRPLSATTVRTVHRVVSKALNDAVRDEVLVRNVASNVPLPRKTRPDLTVWSRQEVAKVLPVAAQDRLHAAWLLALLCGLRRGELAGLRWAEVDLTGGTVRVLSQRTTNVRWEVVTKEPKGTSRRTLDVGPLVLSSLVAHRERMEEEASLRNWTVEPGLVFVQADGRGYHPDRLRELFQQLAKRAGVPVIRLHDARHSCATLALDAGLHPKVVQQMLGHSSWSVTMDLYSHRVERLQREAGIRIEELVTGGDPGEGRSA